MIAEKTKEQLNQDKDRLRLEKFSQGLQKITELSTMWRDGTLKYMSYVEQVDSAIDASGWKREDFYKEIDKRVRHL